MHRQAETDRQRNLPAVVKTTAVGVARGEGVPTPADTGYAGAQKESTVVSMTFLVFVFTVCFD